MENKGVLNDISAGLNIHSISLVLIMLPNQKSEPAILARRVSHGKSWSVAHRSAHSTGTQILNMSFLDWVD